MREEICIMELRFMIDRYGEKFILKCLAELVGQHDIAEARMNFFLNQTLLTYDAPSLVM